MAEWQIVRHLVIVSTRGRSDLSVCLEWRDNESSGRRVFSVTSYGELSRMTISPLAAIRDFNRRVRSWCREEQHSAGNLTLTLAHLSPVQLGKEIPHE